MPNSSKDQPKNPPDMSDMPLTLYDAYLDILHPAASPTVNAPRLIIAPPPGEAMESARAVGQELSTEKGLAMVSRFCFPEFDDETYAKEKALKRDTPSSGKALNKYDIYLQEYYFSNYKNYVTKHRSNTPPYCSTFGPSHHSFAMQLSSGDRVYGHVRRYFPHHPVAKGRIDVGRRGLRAMVILTRANGGEKFYRALFKCLEALQSQKVVMPPSLRNSKKPEQKILHFIHAEHTRLLKIYLKQKNKDTVEGHSVKKIPIIPLKKIEFNNPHYQFVDEFNLQLPMSLVTAIDSTQISSAPILPLLRCLGVAHLLRLFSALLCERRIILVSQSPSRLSACANAVVSTLAQGAVHWQHVYIPVLPPGMKPYLAAPMPYLVGLISCHAKSLETVQGGIGQAVVVDLDSNDIQVHGVKNHDTFIPDLLRTCNDFEPAEWFTSSVEVLKEDLVIALKADRKLVGDMVKPGNGSSGKEGLFRKGLKLIKGYDKQKASVSANGAIARENEEHGEEGKEELYAYGEGVDNILVEEGVKVAFTAFFVNLLGDMKCYLRPPTSSKKLPTFDKKLFLESRIRRGDRQGTPMFAMLKVFKDTQMFEQFVKARIKEVLSQKPITFSAPLFHRVTNHIRFNRLDFAGPEVKNVIRELSEKTPCRYLAIQTSDVRNKALALTSNSRNDQLAPMELSRLSQECKEGTYVLTEVMSVVWERLRDCKGMQWKHGLYGLQMIKELILQGPISAVIEATDGLSRIYKLCSYEYSMRPSAAYQIRGMARSIYDLLMNRVKLFSQRRVCATRRKDLATPPPPLKRSPKLKIKMKFLDAHAAVYPGGLSSEDLLNKSTENVMDPAPAKSSYSDDLFELFNGSVCPAPPADCKANSLQKSNSVPNNIPSGGQRVRPDQLVPAVNNGSQGLPFRNQSAPGASRLPNNPNGIVKSASGPIPIESQYSPSPAYPPSTQQQRHPQPESAQYKSHQQGQAKPYELMPQQRYVAQQQQIQLGAPHFNPELVASQQSGQVNKQNTQRISQFDPMSS